MAKPKKEIPQLITLREILEKVKVEQKDINKLQDKLLEATFFDTYTRYTKEKNTIKVYGKSLTNDEDILEINLTDGTLIYHETISGITRSRKYTSNGFDTSLLMQM